MSAIGLSLSSPPDEDNRWEAVAALADEYADDPAKVAEADADIDGCQSGEHYSAVERALADLAGVPADKLIGSDALAAVLRLARVHGDARTERLRELAEAQIARDDAQAREDAGEAAFYARMDDAA